jgi:hypothetical protein
MKWSLLIATLCFSLFSHAQESRAKMPRPAPESDQLQIFPLDLEMRFEKNAEGEYIDRKPLNLSFSYRAPNWSVLFEYSKFEEESGNATSSIDRKHEEMTVWGRWHLWKFKEGRTRLSVFAAAAVGAYQEEVTTTLAGNSQTDKTGYQMLGGFGGGADISYQLTKTFGVIAAVEGRGLMAQDFDPNPTWGAVVRTGVLFYF